MDEVVYSKDLLKRESEFRKPSAANRIVGGLKNIANSDFFMPVIKVIFLMISIALLLYMTISILIPYAKTVMDSISAGSSDAAATSTSLGGLFILAVPAAFAFSIMVWLWNSFSYRRWDY